MDDGRPPKTSRPQRRKADRDQQKAARARRSRKARTALLAPRPDGVEVLGPYETTYSISEGYGVERDIVQP